MATYRSITTTAVSCLLLAAGSAWAASDYLLEIPGVDGESTGTNSAGTIEVQSFSWGATNTSSASSSTGAGAGKVSMQDMHMTRRQAGLSTGAAREAAPPQPEPARAATVAPADGSIATVLVAFDPASSATAASLSRACGTGKHFDTVVITAGGKRYEMHDVEVTCPAPAAGARAAAGFGKAHELKGHVTLIK